MSNLWAKCVSEVCVVRLMLSLVCSKHHVTQWRPTAATSDGGLLCDTVIKLHLTSKDIKDQCGCRTLITCKVVYLELLCFFNHLWALYAEGRGELILTCYNKINEFVKGKVDVFFRSNRVSCSKHRGQRLFSFTQFLDLPVEFIRLQKEVSMRLRRSFISSDRPKLIPHSAENWRASATKA